MLEDRLVYMNGEFVPWEKATVHQMSHSFGRGSAIFEVISLHDTHRGPAIFRLDEHVRRFFNSANLLDMEIPLTDEELQAVIIDTAKRNNAKKGIIKIMGYYPQIIPDIMPPEDGLSLSIFVIDLAQAMDGRKIIHEEGETLCVSTWRKLDPQTVPIEAKASANYLNGMVARLESVKRGFNNAVMLDTQGYIAEGGTESIFLVDNDMLITPSLGTVLSSISRKSILEMAGILGIKTFEGRLQPDLLKIADEAFCSATPSKIQCIRQIENRVLEPIPGPVSKQLIALMDDILAGQDKRFKEWLFPVDS